MFEARKLVGAMQAEIIMSKFGDGMVQQHDFLATSITLQNSFPLQDSMNPVNIVNSKASHLTSTFSFCTSPWPSMKLQHALAIS